MKLQGIVVPMITPLTGAGMLDYAGLEKLTNHLIDGGCAALFGLGTTGEGPFLSSAMQEEVIRQLCAFSGGRRPVLAGIASASPEDSILLGTPHLQLPALADRLSLSARPAPRAQGKKRDARASA